MVSSVDANVHSANWWDPPPRYLSTSEVIVLLSFNAAWLNLQSPCLLPGVGLFQKLVLTTFLYLEPNKTRCRIPLASPTPSSMQDMFQPVDKQLRDVWDSLLEAPPTKRAKSSDDSAPRGQTLAQASTQSKPSTERPGSSNRSKRQASRPRHADKDSRGDLVHSLARLVLQHQESLQAHNRSCGYVLHLGRHPDLSIVHLMTSTSMAWKEAMNKSPGQVKESLRVVLFKMIMANLVGRVAELSKESGETLAKQSLNASKQFFELRWSTATESLEAVPEGHKISVEEFMKIMEELAANTNADALERVKVLRPTTTLSPTTVLPILIILNPMSASGRRLWELLHQLSSLSCWNLIDATLRQERGKMGPLADQIRKQVFKGKEGDD